MFRVQILTPCSTVIWKRRMKNSIVNWFDGCYTITNFWLRWLIWGDQLRYSSKYIPKYLTWFNDINFFPHSFKFRSQSSCFLFLVKIATSILATFTEIPLTFKHLTRNLLKTLLTALFIYLTESFMFHKQVSSAKWKVLECFLAMLKVC